MNQQYHRPSKDLTDYVWSVLVIEGFSDSDESQLPVITNGIPMLFCKTEKTTEGLENVVQVTLFNKSITPGALDISKNTTIIAYLFKPFVLPSLFNISAKELLDAPYDLSHWKPQKFTALKTQLVYAADTVRKREVLDNLLVQQMKENKQVYEIVQYATDEIILNSGKEIINEILKTLNITERTFQRIFKKHVGVTPTQFRRVCQFQQSFGQLRQNRFAKISDVAFENGFADQSHFIRTFREFAQVTPNDYLKKGLKA